MGGSVGETQDEAEAKRKEREAKRKEREAEAARQAALEDAMRSQQQNPPEQKEFKQLDARGIGTISADLDTLIAEHKALLDESPLEPLKLKDKQSEIVTKLDEYKNLVKDNLRTLQGQIRAPFTDFDSYKHVEQTYLNCTKFEEDSFAKLDPKAFHKHISNNDFIFSAQNRKDIVTNFETTYQDLQGAQRELESVYSGARYNTLDERLAGDIKSSILQAGAIRGLVKNGKRKTGESFVMGQRGNAERWFWWSNSGRFKKAQKSALNALNVQLKAEGVQEIILNKEGHLLMKDKSALTENMVDRYRDLLKVKAKSYKVPIKNIHLLFPKGPNNKQDAAYAPAGGSTPGYVAAAGNTPVSSKTPKPKPDASFVASPTGAQSNQETGAQSNQEVGTESMPPSVPDAPQQGSTPPQESAVVSSSAQVRAQQAAQIDNAGVNPVTENKLEAMADSSLCPLGLQLQGPNETTLADPAAAQTVEKAATTTQAALSPAAAAQAAEPEPVTVTVADPATLPATVVTPGSAVEIASPTSTEVVQEVPPAGPATPSVAVTQPAAEPVAPISGGDLSLTPNPGARKSKEEEEEDESLSSYFERYKETKNNALNVEKCMDMVSANPQLRADFLNKANRSNESDSPHKSNAITDPTSTSGFAHVLWKNALQILTARQAQESCSSSARRTQGSTQSAGLGFNGI